MLTLSLLSHGHHSGLRAYFISMLIYFAQDIAIEGGPLMTAVVGRARLRLIGLNPSNTAGNEVEGTATGGVEKVIAAEGKKVSRTGVATTELRASTSTSKTWLGFAPRLAPDLTGKHVDGRFRSYGVRYFVVPFRGRVY